MSVQWLDIRSIIRVEDLFFAIYCII